jgi:hypothetical protein
MGVPGALRPIQATGEGVASSSAILTQVVESPWTEDDAGVSIDVDNVWAVRTRCLLEYGGGEIDWWTFVPRVLPDGYTARGRNHVVPHIYDHLGEDPFRGVVEFDGMTYVTRPVRWRTPTGQYPADLMDNGYLWVPMNLNKQVTDYAFYAFSPDGVGWQTILVAPIGVSGISPTTGLPYSTSSPSQSTIAFLLNSHIGFRAVTARMVFHATGFSNIYPPDFKIIGNVRVGYSASAKSPPDEPDTITGSHDFTEADLVSQGYDAGAVKWVYTLDIDLGPSLAPLGERQDFMVLYTQQFVGVPGAPLLNPVSHLYWSPRHDVPLWFWASTRNRVAPGGVIL